MIWRVYPITRFSYIPGGDLENFWSINVVWRNKAIWSIVSAVDSVTIRWKKIGAGAEFSDWKRATAKSVVIINESSKLKRLFGEDCFFRVLIYSWYLKRQLLSGCFSKMIPSLYIENGCFTKHPSKNCCLASESGISPNQSYFGMGLRPSILL